MSFGFGFGFTKNYVAALFSPAQLFTGTTQGVWYDPSDINLTWRRNLLTYTEQFDNAAWSKTNTTVTPDVFTAPDGTLTADKLVESTATGTHSVGINRGAGTEISGTASIYIKAGERTKVRVISQDVNYKVDVDLTTGLIIGSNGSAIDAYSITNVGNGWWRVSITETSGFSWRYFFLQILDDSGVLSYTGDGTSGIYIWGAQLEVGSTATTYQRITDGVQDYLQYQAQPVLFQNAAGTTPVTAVEQPVGLMLDKSKGLVLGPELVTNGDFSNGTTGWQPFTASTSISNDTNTLKQTVVSGNSAAARPTVGFATVIGKTYQLTYRVVEVSAGASSAKAYVGTTSGTATGGISGIARNTSGDVYAVFVATATTYFLTTEHLGAAGTFTRFDNISVRELPGNHAFNGSGNSANFPVLSARYNLLTKTEQFDDAAWTKGTGVSVANQKTITFASGGTTEFVRQNCSFAAGVQYTVYVNARSVSGNTTLNADLQNGEDITPITLASQFQSFTRTITPAVARTWIDLQLGGAGTIEIAGIDVRVANDALGQPAYQRVNTSTDYDTVGFKPYLRFNGTNQWLQTNSIDFSYGDKMFVSAGVRKLSDAATSIVAELSPQLSLNNGAFYIAAPSVAAASDYQFANKGTTVRASTYTNSAVASPITNVISGIGDISGDQSILRVNGTQAAISTADQGTGNYGNYPIFIGARAGSSLWFNGRLYSLITAGKLANAVEITSTETYLNQKTGAF